MTISSIQMLASPQYYILTKNMVSYNYYTVMKCLPKQYISLYLLHEYGATFNFYSSKRNVQKILPLCEPIPLSSMSGTYWIQNCSIDNVTLHAVQLRCSYSGGGWMRVANLGMNNQTWDQQCPSEFRDMASPIKTSLWQTKLCYMCIHNIPC